MSREKTWCGYDYVLRKQVERTRKEWRELIAQATRTVRAGRDLLLFSGYHIVAEVYDKD